MDARRWVCAAALVLSPVAACSLTNNLDDLGSGVGQGGAGFAGGFAVGGGSDAGQGAQGGQGGQGGQGAKAGGDGNPGGARGGRGGASGAAGAPGGGGAAPGGAAGANGGAGGTKGGAAGASGAQAAKAGASGLGGGGPGGTGASGKGGASGGAGASGASGSSGCAGGKAHCDGDPAHLCETDLATDLNNCGACGVMCGGNHAAPQCAGGACALHCQAGFLDCDQVPGDGCEVDPASDPKNCGACGKACPAGANAQPVCVGGACGVSCAQGFAACAGAGDSACESNTLTDVNNCGGCGKACLAPPNASPVCVTGVCEFTCASGFYAQGGACASFGGLFVQGVGGGGCGTCLTPNPATGGCSCPGGTNFGNQSALAAACGPIEVAFCSPPAPSTQTDWGGQYVSTAPCGGAGAGCMTPNPYTNDCSCPAGSTAIAMKVADPFCQTQPKQAELGVCVNLGAPTVSFGGAFQTDSSGGCMVPNPKSSMGCACPPGTTEHLFGAALDAANPGGPSSVIHICNN